MTTTSGGSAAGPGGAGGGWDEWLGPSTSASPAPPASPAQPDPPKAPATRLPQPKAPCFGACPALDPFLLLRCRLCKARLKPVALRNHFACRHPERWSSGGDISYLLSPPILSALPSTSAGPAPADGNIFDQLGAPLPGGSSRSRASGKAAAVTPTPKRTPTNRSNGVIHPSRSRLKGRQAAGGRTRPPDQLQSDDSRESTASASSESQSYSVKPSLKPGGSVVLTFRKGDVEGEALALGPLPPGSAATPPKPRPAPKGNRRKQPMLVSPGDQEARVLRSSPAEPPKPALARRSGVKVKAEPLPSAPQPSTSAAPQPSDSQPPSLPLQVPRASLPASLSLSRHPEPSARPSFGGSLIGSWDKGGRSQGVLTFGRRHDALRFAVMKALDPSMSFRRPNPSPSEELGSLEFPPPELLPQGLSPLADLNDAPEDMRALLGDDGSWDSGPAQPPVLHPSVSLPSQPSNHQPHQPPPTLHPHTKPPQPPPPLHQPPRRQPPPGPPIAGASSSTLRGLLSRSSQQLIPLGSGGGGGGVTGGGSRRAQQRPGPPLHVHVQGPSTSTALPSPATTINVNSLLRSQQGSQRNGLVKLSDGMGPREIPLEAVLEPPSMESVEMGPLSPSPSASDCQEPPRRQGRGSLGPPREIPLHGPPPPQLFPQRSAPPQLFAQQPHHQAHHQPQHSQHSAALHQAPALAQIPPGSQLVLIQQPPPQLRPQQFYLKQQPRGAAPPQLHLATAPPAAKRRRPSQPVPIAPNGYHHHRPPLPHPHHSAHPHPLPHHPQGGPPPQQLSVAWGPDGKPRQVIYQHGSSDLKPVPQPPPLRTFPLQ